jgi:hypothetical protein
MAGTMVIEVTAVSRKHAQRAAAGVSSLAVKRGQVIGFGAEASNLCRSSGENSKPHSGHRLSGEPVRL